LDVRKTRQSKRRDPLCGVRAAGVRTFIAPMPLLSGERSG
jgi:hypothetical protein